MGARLRGDVGELAGEGVAFALQGVARAEALLQQALRLGQLRARVGIGPGAAADQAAHALAQRGQAARIPGLARRQRGFQRLDTGLFILRLFI